MHGKQLFPWLHIFHKHMGSSSVAIFLDFDTEPSLKSMCRFQKKARYLNYNQLVLCGDGLPNSRRARGTSFPVPFISIGFFVQLN